MTAFTAELEQVFGVAPSRETGLVIDTFDGADFGGDVRDSWTRGDVGACGWTRADVVYNSGTCRVSVQA
jgi:hypothetical protein